MACTKMECCDWKPGQFDNNLQQRAHCGAVICSQINLASNHSIAFYLMSSDVALGLVSMDNVSLTKIICNRNFGNELAFTHSKDYLYYFVTDI